MQTDLTEMLEFLRRAKYSARSELVAEDQIKKLAMEFYCSVIEEEVKNPGFGESIKELLKQFRHIK